MSSSIEFEDGITVLVEDPRGKALLRNIAFRGMKNHSLRILLVTFDPPTEVGGIEGRARNYTENLLRTGHFVEILSLSSQYAGISTETFAGTKMVKLPPDILLSLRVAMNEISNNRIDAVFMLTGAITIPGIFLLLFTRIFGTKSAILFYGKDILQAHERSLLYTEMVLSSFLAKKIIVNSNFTRSLISTRFCGKVSILYPAVDAGALDVNAERYANSDQTILFVGRLVERKGVGDLLAAFKLMSAKIPEATLEIVGDGPQRVDLEKLAKSFGIESRVRFFGTLRGGKLLERYKKATVFVMPSKQMKGDVEGFGTVFLEAGLFGKPSVGTFSGGIPEAVKNNETGLLVPQDNIPLLAEAIEKLLLDKKLRETLGHNARERVLRNFTWDRSTKELLKILDFP